jgi:phosphoheptose isomerase
MANYTYLRGGNSAINTNISFDTAAGNDSTSFTIYSKQIWFSGAAWDISIDDSGTNVQPTIVRWASSMFVPRVGEKIPKKLTRFDIMDL